MSAVNSIVLTRKRENRLQFPWESVYSMGRREYLIYRVAKKLGYRWHSAKFDTAITAHKPKVLHSHYGYIGWYDIPLAKKHSLPHIVTYYGADLTMYPTRNPIWKERYQTLFAHADYFLCEGPHMANTLIQLGCPSEKVKVHRLGVDVEKIKFSPRTYEPHQPIRILLAGSFREKKGLPYALKAIGRFRRKFSSVEITVIGDSGGTAREEREKEEILSAIREYDLAPATRLLGYQPHSVLMHEAYNHHIFLSPSVTATDGDSEGGAPVTIIEMLASGMPVISTNHCDIPQVIQHGYSGLLAEERDVDGLVAQLEWLASHPTAWASMAKAGRDHVERYFSAPRQACELVNIYQSLLNEKDSSEL